MENVTEQPKKSFILGSLTIMRPINCIMGSLTVIIGLLNTRTGIPFNIFLINLILGIATYYFLAASGMIINDIYDIEIDKINRPKRPIPSGSVSLTQAKVLFIITYGIGVVLAILHSLLFGLGLLNIFLAMFFGFIGWIYAKYGKKSGFPGNILVSVSFSIGLIYGAVLNSSIIPTYIYFFFLTSFFLLMSREVIKGCEDIEGDKEEGVKTLAIQLGSQKAKIFSMVFAILAVVFFVLPIFTNIINPLLFLIFMIIGLIIVIGAIVYMFKGNLKRKDFKNVSLMLKAGALLGLIAFIFASF